MIRGIPTNRLKETPKSSYRTLFTRRMEDMLAESGMSTQQIDKKVAKRDSTPQELMYVVLSAGLFEYNTTPPVYVPSEGTATLHDIVKYIHTCHTMKPEFLGKEIKTVTAGLSGNKYLLFSMKGNSWTYEVRDLPETAHHLQEGQFIVHSGNLVYDPEKEILTRKK